MTIVGQSTLGPANPSSPWNFATMMSQLGGTKLLGGNLVQVPTAYGGPNTAYQYAWIFENWSTTYPNWIYPQMQNWARRGANFVRIIWCADGILAGSITQSAAEAALAQLISDARTLNLAVAVTAMATGSSYLGSYTAAQYFAPVQSLLNDVLIPNRDVIVYLEAGDQESTSFAEVTSNTLAAMAKAVTTIPILISMSAGQDFSHLTPSNVDLFGYHYYPGFLTGDYTLNTWIEKLYAILQTTGGKPVLIEEFGRNESGGYQDKADFFNVVSEGAFGHPMVAGVQVWGGFGPTPDGDWTYYSPPSNPYMSPAQEWTDTFASAAYRTWGSQNRNLQYLVSLNSPVTINSTSAYPALNAASRSVSNPTVSNISLTTVLPQGTTVTCNVTFSISGMAPSQYQIQLGAVNQSTSVFTAFGSPVTVTGNASNQRLVASGTIPSAGNWAFGFEVQQASGSSAGRLTALNGTLICGATSFTYSTEL